MASIKRKWDLLSEEKRSESIRELTSFFKTQRDEEIGMIAAESILDHFLQSVGIELYNKGVEDSITLLRGRFETLELDMDSLLKK